MIQPIFYRHPPPFSQCYGLGVWFKVFRYFRFHCQTSVFHLCTNKTPPLKTILIHRSFETAPRYHNELLQWSLSVRCQDSYRRSVSSCRLILKSIAAGFVPRPKTPLWYFYYNTFRMWLVGYPQIRDYNYNQFSSLHICTTTI